MQARVGFTSSTSVSGSVRSKPETGTMSELGGCAGCCIWSGARGKPNGRNGSAIDDRNSERGFATPALRVSAEALLIIHSAAACATPHSPHRRPRQRHVKRPMRARLDRAFLGTVHQHGMSRRLLSPAIVETRREAQSTGSAGRKRTRSRSRMTRRPGRCATIVVLRKRVITAAISSARVSSG